MSKFYYYGCALLVTLMVVQTVALRADFQGGSAQDLTSSDSRVRREIQEALSSQSASSPYRGINVTVRSGKVVLQGTVNSIEDKKAVEAKVSGIGGVSAVDNELQVRR